MLKKLLNLLKSYLIPCCASKPIPSSKTFIASSVENKNKGNLVPTGIYFFKINNENTNTMR